MQIMWLVELTKVKFPWVAPLSLFCGKSVTYARGKETNRRFTSGVLDLQICKFVFLAVISLFSQALLTLLQMKW